MAHLLAKHLGTGTGQFAAYVAHRSQRAHGRDEVLFGQSRARSAGLDPARVAFGRWSIEQVFREVKEELGFDHYECRGWRCIHRHLACVILSQLFCAQVRQKLSPSEDVLSAGRLTLEQVRRAVAIFVIAQPLPARHRRTCYRRELDRQQYY